MPLVQEQTREQGEESQSKGGQGTQGGRKKAPCSTQEDVGGPEAEEPVGRGTLEEDGHHPISTPHGDRCPKEQQVTEAVRGATRCSDWVL